MRGIGEPYLKMTEEQREVWSEIVADASWLRAHHRIALRQVCALAVRLDDPDMGVSAHKALSSLLSKLGLTPVDDTKVLHDPGDTEDPEDQFFDRPN